MKKTISLLMALVCCFGMTGCNKDDKDIKKLDSDASVEFDFSDSNSSKEEKVEFPVEITENTLSNLEKLSVSPNHSNELTLTITGDRDPKLAEGDYVAKGVSVKLNGEIREFDRFARVLAYDTVVFITLSINCEFVKAGSEIEIEINNFYELNETAYDEEGGVDFSDISDKVAISGDLKLKVDVTEDFGNARVDLKEYGYKKGGLIVSNRSVGISNSQAVFDKDPEASALTIHMNDKSVVEFTLCSVSEVLDKDGKATGEKTAAFVAPKDLEKYEIRDIAYLQMGDTKIQLNN